MLGFIADLAAKLCIGRGRKNTKPGKESKKKFWRRSRTDQPNTITQPNASNQTPDWTIPPLDYSPQRRRPVTSSSPAPSARVHFEIGPSRAIDCRQKRLSSLEQRVRAKTAGLLSKSLESEIAHAKSQLPYTKAYCDERSLLGSGKSDKDSSSSSEAERTIEKEDGPFAWLFWESKTQWAVKPHYYTPSLACSQTFGEPQKPTRWSISSASDTEECNIEWDDTDGHVIVRGFGPLPANSDPPSPKRRENRQSQPLIDLQKREDEVELQKCQREKTTAEKFAALQAHQLRKRDARKLQLRRELQREMRQQVIDKSRQTDTVKLACSRLANHNAQVSARSDNVDDAIASSSDEEDDAVTVLDCKETSGTEAEARLAMYRATAVQA